MLKSIIVCSLSALMLGAVYALITWVLCGHWFSRRACLLVAAGLTVMHHFIAGVVEIYFGETILSLILFYTIKVP